jgi:hypothetical protein
MLMSEIGLKPDDINGLTQTLKEKTLRPEDGPQISPPEPEAT